MAPIYNFHRGAGYQHRLPCERGEAIRLALRRPSYPPLPHSSSDDTSRAPSHLNFDDSAYSGRQHPDPEDTAAPPLPLPKDVMSHRKRANRDAADALRAMLLEDCDDRDEAEYTSTPSPMVATGSNAPLSVYGGDGRGDGHRAATFPAAYHPPPQAIATGSNAIASSSRYSGSGRRRHNTFPRSPRTVPTHKSLHRLDKHNRGLHVLAHAGGGDQEAEWRSQNHHLLIGQAGAERASEGSSGCDLAMPRAYSTVAPTVRLDPDLPPLSAEHPARVWNAMIHSLAPELQPIVRWEYDNVRLGEEWAYSARMTVILPPTHPAIANHPVAKALPKNRFAREYAEAMSVLGGVRSWSGPPRKLKADAQNTTITLCIRENALAWVHAPVMAPINENVQTNKLQTPTVDLGVELVGETTAVIEILHDQDIGVYGCRLSVGREPHFQHYEEDTVHQSTEAAQEAVCKRAVELNVRGFLAWLQGSEISDEALESTTDEKNTEMLDIGEEVRTKTDDGRPPAMDFEEAIPPNEVNQPTEKEAESSAPVASAEADEHTTSCSPHADDHTLVPPSRVVTPVKSEPEDDLFGRPVQPAELDWQLQLAYFCHTSGLPPPSWSQRIVRRPDGQSTLFVGKVVIGGKRYEAVNHHENIRAARQSIARQVFTETFGQEPAASAAVADLPPGFHP